MKEYTAEQIKAIESVNINTAVVAGAGSGKTSVLVERYIRLVAGGTDCRRILAITFTEKAAGEMSARIRAQMAERAGACAREGDSAGETNWLAQKDLLPRAYIGTIHGLCAGIIRANPMAAGVAPDAQILDESGGRLLLAEAAQAAFARLLPDSAALASLCEEYGYYRVFQYTKSIMEKFTAEETADAGFPGRLAAGCRGALERTAAAKREFFLALDELLSLSDSVKGTKLDGALAQMRRNLAEIEKTLTNLPDDMDSLSFIDALLGKVHRQGKIKLAVDAAKISWEKVVGGCRDCRALKIMPCWAEVLKACAGEFALLKKRRMALTFSDLENIALKTLKEDQTLLRKYMDKYRHIMIDEFQDTSKAQKEIAYLLSGGDAQTLRGEKLFIVGDERQSIYRFRGADVGVFIRARQEMLVNSADAQIELSANFRSREEIIAVCNHLFSCPAPGLSDMGYKPMRIGRIEQEKRAAGEPVELLLVNEAVGGGHEAEAAAIARRLLLLRGEGFSFADMAVILRARTHLSAYTNALEAFGAPYSLLDGQGFFQAPEIIDILNILRFLENCLRDLPLLGLLRSPLFGLDDNAITLVALSGGSEPFWHKLKNFPAGGLNGEQKQLAERAIKILEKLAQAARILSPGPLLRAVIEELRLMPLLLAYPDGRQKYANMEKFVDTAFAFEQETDGGLGEFIAHIDGLSAVGAREGLEQLEDEEGDAIKLLTIHKAKGLEFKVVVIADCGAAFPVDRSSFFYDEDCGLGIKVRCGGELRATACFAKARENDKNKNMEENRRLLYVGMTRARDKLILSAGGTKGQSWLEWINNSFENRGDGFLYGGESKILLWEDDAALKTLAAAAAETEIKTETKKEIEKSALTFPAADEPRDFAKLLRQTLPAPWQSKNQFCFSATALNDYRRCPKLFYYKYLAGLPEYQTDAVRGEAARPGALPPKIEGLIAHSVLADIGEYTFQEALDKALAKYLDEGDGDAQRENIAQWLSLYIEDSLWRETAARKPMREVSFKLPLLAGSGGEPFWFSGSIDSLSFVGSDGLWIADYKTDRDTEGKTEEYAPQMMIYALAAEMLYPGRKAAKAELHFIRRRARAAVDITGKRISLVAGIRELCAEITGKEQEESGFAAQSRWCGWCGCAWFCAGENPIRRTRSIPRSAQGVSGRLDSR